MTADPVAALRAAGKAGLARALSAAEARRRAPDTLALLDAAHRGARAHVLGLTGPPGVGKSTLVNALIARRRAAGESIGVVAVDPSSRRTGGALLGDRARIATDPEDEGAFVRSLAARDRLGGLSDFAVAAMVLMRAVMDHVILESVGIGQSESDIAYACDTVVLCVQPGSGDALQFMKAGVMELPHVIAVTKADMGAVARKAVADVEGALSLAAPPPDGWRVPVVLLSATKADGLDALDAAVARHRAHLAQEGRGEAARAAQARAWVEDHIRAEHGRAGLGALTSLPGLDPTVAPFAAMDTATRALAR